MSQIKYEDNVRVEFHAGEHPYSEYLAIHFAEVGENGEWPKWSVSIGRYMVPGRVDVYKFDFTPGRSGEGPRVRFFTDTDETLVSALKLVQRDLKRRQVIKLLMEAADRNLRWHRDLLFLMENISPESRAATVFQNASERARRRIVSAKKRREKLLKSAHSNDGTEGSSHE